MVLNLVRNLLFIHRLLGFISRAHIAALQYLDWADFQKYMKAIADNRDNLVHDPEYLQAFHRECLGLIKGESKKTAG